MFQKQSEILKNVIELTTSTEESKLMFKLKASTLFDRFNVTSNSDVSKDTVTDLDL